jgi:hypothetical protein
MSYDMTRPHKGLLDGVTRKKENPLKTSQNFEAKGKGASSEASSLDTTTTVGDGDLSTVTNPKGIGACSFFFAFRDRFPR